MILSRSRGFLFVKGRKVGGTSVEIALDAICGPDDILTPITPRDERRRLLDYGEGCRNYGADPAALGAWKARLRAAAEGEDLPPAPRGTLANHAGVAGIGARGVDTSGLPLLLCERSPYAKIVSMVCWDLRQASYARGGSLALADGEIRAEIDRQIADGRFRRVLNLPAYRDARGRIPAFALLRTDRLQADFSTWLVGMGCRDIVLPVAKRLARADERDLSIFFTPAQLDLIGATFADEFALFGFERLPR